MKGTICVLGLLLFAVIVECAPPADKITNLPGKNFVTTFEEYAGYINLPGGSRMFYWFAASQNNPSVDPLFLWLQGGPGCSSLLGFFTENGPYNINPDQSLSSNPYSWNKRVNTLYLESPVGVGYSWLQGERYETGDNKTADSTYEFLQLWFQAFPEYLANDFYISGESYAGHYVPQLAYKILTSGSKINLKGILVGNPYTDDVIDDVSLPPFIFYHHLCSLSAWNLVQQSCNLSSNQPLISRHEKFVDYRKRTLKGTVATCQQALRNMYQEVGTLINEYDIYAPCLEGSSLGCMDYTALVSYLNSPSVQAAVHARKPADPWDVCTSDILYSEVWRSVIPIYPYLMERIHVTVFAGDVTYNVPALGTQQWVEALGRPVVSDYQSWVVNGQVAGYYKAYKGITYVTVLHSGHMVPTYTPEAALYLLDQYLKGVF